MLTEYLLNMDDCDKLISESQERMQLLPKKKTDKIFKIFGG